MFNLSSFAPFFGPTLLFQPYQLVFHMCLLQGTGGWVRRRGWLWNLTTSNIAESLCLWMKSTAHENQSPIPLGAAAKSAAKLLQSCPTLCDPIDGSPPGSPVPGILQARTLEWVAISFSNA